MVGELRPGEVVERLRSDGARVLLLDVREPFERRIARIDPSIHIPMNDVPGRIAELPKDRTIIVYCHHGNRSEMVAAYLENEGFADVINLVGGIDLWAQQVDPHVRRY